MKRRDDIVLFLIVSGIFGVSLSCNKIYLYHIFMVLVVANLILSIRNDEKALLHNKLPTKMQTFFYFMIIWYILSIFWSIYPRYSIRYMVYILSGTFYSLTVIYYINSNRNKLDRVYLVSSKTFIFIMLVSFLEAFIGIRFPRIPYSSSYISASAFFGNINNLSTVLVMLMPFFLFHQNLLVKYIGSLSIIYMVVINSSRANLLAIIVVVIIYLLAYRKDVKYSNIEKPIIALVVLVLIIGLFNYSTNDRLSNNGTVKESFSALQSYINLDKMEEYDSVGIRRKLIFNGIIALKETKGLGVGGGASVYIQEKSNSTKGTTSMHNFWVEVLVEAGVLFFIVFLVWYFRMLIRLYLISQRCDGERLRYYSASSSLALIGFVPAAVSPSTTIYLFPMWLLFGFSIAVINVYDGLSN